MEPENDPRERVHVLAITGSPATGKTALARALAHRLGAAVIDVKALVESGDVPSQEDDRRCTRIIDEDVLEQSIHPRLGGGREGLTIVDSHLSHRLSLADAIVVLRCPPSELLVRYEERGYEHTKMRENLEAEYLGVILDEAVATDKAVLEMESVTALPVKDVTDWILHPTTLLKDIDYTEDFTQLIIDNRIPQGGPP